MYNNSIINNFTNFIVVWCNGSTKDFGSFSIGSNPITATIACRDDSLLFMILCFIVSPQVEVINTFACGVLCSTDIAELICFDTIKYYYTIENVI